MSSLPEILHPGIKNVAFASYFLNSRSNVSVVLQGPSSNVIEMKFSFTGTLQIAEIKMPEQILYDARNENIIHITIEVARTYHPAGVKKINDTPAAITRRKIRFTFLYTGFRNQDERMIIRF